MSNFNLGNILFAAFWLIWAILAVKPADRKTFWLESIMPIIAFPLLYWAHWEGFFSRLSLIVLFVFSVMHIIAAQHAYSETPWGNWVKRKFSLKRNYYDRVVHFSYGLLGVPLFSDLFQHMAPIETTRALLVFAVIISIGSIYEILEYAVVKVTGAEEGAEFLGLQGDIWDAQKDMLAQTIGALIGVGFLLLV